MQDCRRFELERLSVESKTRGQRYERRDLRQQVRDYRSELEQVHQALQRRSDEYSKELRRLAVRIRDLETERDRFQRLWEDLLESRRTQQQVARISKRLGKPISVSDAH